MDSEAFFNWCAAGITNASGSPMNRLNIKTLEGTMVASLGDWIIKGVNGDFYPCKPDIFEKSMNQFWRIERMKTYIGVKMVQAEPQTKDWKEDYKVVYPSSKKQPSGYTQWCLKDVFEEVNREVAGAGIPFSKSLEALKQGKKTAWQGWNGKNMWIRLFQKTELPMDCALTYPFLVIKYPVNHPAYLAGICIPWIASQTDILADDWHIVE